MRKTRAKSRGGRRRSRPPAAVVEQLTRYFRRNGYVRWQDEERLLDEGCHIYKKGHEVRLVADSLEELATIRALLEQAGFQPGRAFAKGRQFRQPLYGKKNVARFLQMVSGEKA